MANSKSKARARAQQRARAQAKKAAVTAPGVRATPSPAAGRTVRPAATATAAVVPFAEEPVETEYPSGPPRWFQWTTFVLAIIGLGISAYETYAHYTGSHLAGCPAGNGTFNCTAVITSAQSMVFGVLPVAVLGLAFYVFAVPALSPWAWRFTGIGRLSQRGFGWIRLGSLIIGMGFVMYLIYAEVYQIGDVCEYCTGVHIVTFILFCMTVFAAALWGLGERRARR
ncbi:MAG TPA: vitamin K epoxide reductase family protein [Trebonia sp.]|nr:vitamin K epoxide reductase family protein [Trebonia sp.]